MLNSFSSLISASMNESYETFNNVFSECTKVVHIEPCDVEHPLLSIEIDKDGHDNIFSDETLINESKTGLDEQVAEWIMALSSPCILEKSDILKHIEPTWKYYLTFKKSQNVKPLIVAIFDWTTNESKDIWRTILSGMNIMVDEDFLARKQQYYSTSRAGGLLEKYEAFDLLTINEKYATNVLVIHEFSHYFQDILGIFIDKLEETKFNDLKLGLTPIEKERLTKSFELKYYDIDELIDQFFSSMENEVYMNSHVHFMLRRMFKEFSLEKDKFVDFIIDTIENYDYSRTFSEQFETVGFTRYDKVALLFLLFCSHFNLFWDKVKQWMRNEDFS